MVISENALGEGINSLCRKEREFVSRIRNGLVLGIFFVFVSLSALAGNGSSGIIKEIIIRGNLNVRTEEIMEVIESELEQLLSAEDVREDLKAIYKMGLFSSVKALKEESREGVILIYQVEENPLIVEIKVQGVGEREGKDIQKLIPLQKGEIWNYDKVRESREKIEEYYQGKGYTSTEVEVSPLLLREGECRALFTIKKGKRVKVVEVEIEGNTAFSEAKLRIHMKTKYRRFFDPDVLKEDMTQLIDIYRQTGYYFAYFEEPRYVYFQKKKEDWVRIFLPLVEGKKLTVSEIKVERAHLFTPSEIIDQFQPGRGEVFNPEEIRKSIERIQNKYGEKGYVYARIIPDVQFIEGEALVRIVLRIEEGQQVRVGKISLEGNEKTQVRVFKHTFPLKEGDILNTRMVREGWRRLYNLGFFKSVDIETHQTSLPSRIDLSLKVKENERLGRLYLGATYSSATGLGGFIQLARDNLWGQGKKIAVDWEFGQDKNEYDVSYLDRWWGDTPTRVTLKVYSRNTTYSWTEEGYQKGVLGFGIGVGRSLLPNWDVFVNLKNENIDISELEDKPLPEDVESGETVGRSLELVLMNDLRVRDEAFNSYRGSLSSLSVEESGGFLGGDISFTKYRAEWRGYWRQGDFWKSPILAVRLRGLLGERLPYYERFYIGGQDTLRGYELNEFQGDRALLGTAELRLPLNEEMMFSVFLDSGRVWGGDSVMEDYAVGWGCGLNMRLPLGILRFDWGFGQEGQAKFYFGMGESF